MKQSPSPLFSLFVSGCPGSVYKRGTRLAARGYTQRVARERKAGIKAISRLRLLARPLRRRTFQLPGGSNAPRELFALNKCPLRDARSIGGLASALASARLSEAGPSVRVRAPASPAR